MMSQEHVHPLSTDLSDAPFPEQLNVNVDAFVVQSWDGEMITLAPATR